MYLISRNGRQCSEHILFLHPKLFLNQSPITLSLLVPTLFYSFQRTTTVLSSQLGPIAKIPDAQETISTVQVNATYSSVQVLANSAKKTIVGMQNVRAVSSASLAPFNAPLQLLTIWQLLYFRNTHCIGIRTITQEDHINMGSALFVDLNGDGCLDYFNSMHVCIGFSTRMAPLITLMVE